LKTALPSAVTFWRVEGSLLDLSVVRPVAFFTRNAQSFSERWARRGGLGLLALVMPLLYAVHRVFAMRILHTLLRGVSQDRLDLLGEEYFNYVLKPRLKKRGVEKLKELMATGAPVVLVSHGVDHIIRPLAIFLGVRYLVANRLEFRDGLATGRLLNPVIRPRGGLARLIGRNPDGRVSGDELSRRLGFSDRAETLNAAVAVAERRPTPQRRPIVLFKPRTVIQRLSVKECLAGKHILLIGATGFIGKVWLVKALSDLPDIGRIYLLIRRARSATALQRFEKIVEESPVFEAFQERYGSDLSKFMSDRVEVVEGDVSQPGLGLEPKTRARLCRTLDLILNSAGLTDFNPDLRTALSINVDGMVQLLDFLRQCDHAGLLHLSTCFVAGFRDGRVTEELWANYTPAHVPDFDAEQEHQALNALVKEIETRSESPEVREELLRQVRERETGSKNLADAALENQLRKNRIRWVRGQMIEAGMRRARELGWPNTYTFTKSLAESLIAKLGRDLPVAVVRPSIVESSTQQPFRGWNEGVNTSAPLSYLLGTYFRQLPSNKRKRLDLIPVDLVCRGMMLICAALVQRCHERLYQLATSASNPCDMGRAIELTCLAHRKHYLAQEGLEHWLRARFDTISVSKARYQKLSAPGQKAMVRAIRLISALLPFAQSPLVRKERDLERVEKLIELYEPFILYNELVFEAENVQLLSQALPAEEKEAFGYDADSIDWWEYWINIHIPALRKWSYPLIEGRPLEVRARRGFRLLAPSQNSAARSEGDDEGPPSAKTMGTGATWPSS